MEKSTDFGIKNFLDEKVEKYNTLAFLEADPISIPHKYSLRQDIEIAGFLTATIAWGNRKMILKSAEKMMRLMGESPYDFILSHNEKNLYKLNGSVHRTFNSDDLMYFLKAIKNLYKKHGGLEVVFKLHSTATSMQPSIHHFKKEFFSLPHPARTRKHISDPATGSAAKRINMFLRWMVRKDNKGVDFGIWKSFPPSILSCPLDVHSGTVARMLGLINRKQNDAKALEELDSVLRKFDPVDPAKYDFALFGLGVEKNSL